MVTVPLWGLLGWLLVTVLGYVIAYLFWRKAIGNTEEALAQIRSWELKWIEGERPRTMWDRLG